jgi:maltose alpha-D-glucosyltransferase / alpha-amylase
MISPHPSAQRKHSMEQQQDLLWFKDAIVYELHVKAFRDGNGDGFLDFS